MVVTFEWNGALRESGRHESLNSASRALPAGVYTTLRTYHGHRLLRFERHVGRLNESAQLLGKEAKLVEGEARRAVSEALRATGHGESRLRLTWALPRLFVSVEPFEPPAPEVYRDGAACVTLPLHRESPHAKDTRFIATANGAYRSLPAGIHEGLMVAEDGAILEGLSSNFFAVEGGVVRTEERRALAGVTRSLVLELAGPLAPLSFSAATVSELPSLSEAFITSVSRGIVPVVRIDGRAVGGGRPGPLTQELTARLRELEEKEAAPVP